MLTLTGGAIGQGLPNAVGAAIACPRRPVLALIGDGPSMYTIQALWTMAREQLDFARLAQGMGVHGVRVETADALPKALDYALSHPGPHLIEAVVPESLNGVKRKVLPIPDHQLPCLRFLRLADNAPHAITGGPAGGGPSEAASMLAMTRTAPPQRTQCSTSIAKTRSGRRAQLIAACRSIVDLPGCAVSRLPLPLAAGVTSARQWRFGASTP